MCSSKRELGIGMIKGGRAPGLGGVADGTIMTEIVLDMIGIRNPVEIILMTGITIYRGSGIPTGVTVDAG